MSDDIVLMNRLWAMHSKHTFTIPPIKALISRYFHPAYLWCDPFCGYNSPAQIKNDLNPDVICDSHVDALVFLKELPTNRFDGVFFDPPYSFRQAKEVYQGFTPEHTNMKYSSEIKNELARILKSHGCAMCFGWNTQGLGKQRGCHIIEILMVPHGGSRNDTLCTVECKI